MRASAFVYPWDIVGDPDAAGRIAELGVPQVTLASAYHSTRALTARHPRHRIVTARHSAVFYPPDEARWAGRRLRPAVQDWVPDQDPFATAARALRDAGLRVHSWVILAHNSQLGQAAPEVCVRNAYGDRYVWAPCIAQPEVRQYAVTLAAEAAVRPGAEGTELESCGWYGLAHLHAHDKTAGVGLSGAGQYLMSLCFCPSCWQGYAGAGVDPAKLREAVRAALEPLWSGRGDPSPTDRGAEWAEVVALLGAERAAAVAGWREEVARRFQRETVAAVRQAAGRPDFPVLLHADPAPHRCGANVGVVPATVLQQVDGLVLPCAGGAAERAAVLTPFARHRRPHTVLAANLNVVAGMGGSPGTLAEDAAHARELGADEVRLYHAGLASDQDLDQVRQGLARLR